MGWGTQAKPVQAGTTPSMPVCSATLLLGPSLTRRAHGPGILAQSLLGGLLGGLREWPLGRARLPQQLLSSLPVSMGVPLHPPHRKGPRKLPAIRVPKAWGAVTWSRPRLGLHGRGRGSGSPQIRGLAKTCHRWPHGPADPTTTPQGSSLAPPSAHPGDTGRDSVNPDWQQGRWKLQGSACSCGLWVGNGSEQGGRGHSAALRLL